jgi:hypothetical protein
MVLCYSLENYVLNIHQSMHINLKFLLEKWKYNPHVGFIITYNSVMTDTVFDCNATRSGVSLCQQITLMVHCT